MWRAREPTTTSIESIGIGFETRVKFTSSVVSGPTVTTCAAGSYPSSSARIECPPGGTPGIE